MFDPDYPHVIISFIYRDYKIKIAVDKFENHSFYTAWADHSFGSAVAVPYAINTKTAVIKAKSWVDIRIRG